MTTALQVVLECSHRGILRVEGVLCEIDKMSTQLNGALLKPTGDWPTLYSATLYAARGM
jgi:hypothetical protein